ncbi:MAG: hypothetical protein GQ527_09670, partial [Bacteroidales bacterium]|nr:hypothetical protein [Bacteroidales bacterium]
MKRIYLLLLLVLSFYIGVAQIDTPPQHYICYHIDKEINVDGDITDSIWELASWSHDFVDIQGEKMPAPYLQTKVKMLWSQKYLYIAAFLQEPHIWAKIENDEEVMFYDNDFEIFIDPNGDNHNYYEFEFNALNKKWDLFLRRPYRNKVKPDLKWNCQGLVNQTKIFGSINKPEGKQDSAWTIEIAIPLDCIKNEVKDGDHWRINFSRVEWETKIDGQDYIKLDQAENNWVWSPQGSINMHMPEYWGHIQFSEIQVGYPKVKAIVDSCWYTKLDLMKAHNYERKYFLEHGIFNSVLPEEAYAQDMSIQWQGEQYIISKKGSAEQWNVNENGRLWKTKEQAIPRFWVWMGANKDYSIEKWEEVFYELNSLGIRGVLVSANPVVIRKIIPIAEKYQIQVHIWMWALNRGDAPPEYLSVNDLGKSLAEEKAYVGYYKFMSPALAEVHQFVKSKVAELQRIDGIAGIHLDYIRYVDVFLPKGLLPKYQLIQDDILPEFDYGYHPE